MYFPAIHDERTTLRNYLQVQLQAIRDAAHGLTDEQARGRCLACSSVSPWAASRLAWSCTCR